MIELEPNDFENLQWQAALGVDLCLEDAPIDRFAQSAQEKTEEKSTPKASDQRQKQPLQRKASTTQNAPINRTAAIIPDQNAVEDAASLAQNAKTLDELRDVMLNFTGCNLRLAAKHMVFADGNPQADVMLIGEAPGRDEDMQGLPFVGRAGQLLDKMLASISLNRETCYITNVIPWRPPGNRTPTPQETEICRPFIDRHVELANPKTIMLLGGSSAKTMLKTTDGIMRLRGNWKEITIGEKSWPVLPTLHPAYLLRQPAQKRLAWQDLLKLDAHLKNSG